MILLILGIQCPATLVRHYTFDDNFLDSSPTAAHGTLTDVGTLGNSGITQIPGEFIVGTGALTLSADRDYIDIPSQTFSSGVAYSVAFWAKKATGDTGGASDWDMVIGQRDNANFFIALNDASGTGGRLGLRWRSVDSTTARQADFVSPLSFDWHHHAIVSDGSSITYYLDGGFVSTATGKATGFIYNTIGEAYTSANNFDFHGQIDDMRVYSSALTEQEVQGLVSLAIPEPGSLLLVFFGAGILALLRNRRLR